MSRPSRLYVFLTDQAPISAFSRHVNTFTVANGEDWPAIEVSHVEQAFEGMLALKLVGRGSETLYLHNWHVRFMTTVPKVKLPKI